jgi:alkanesulfonate monooxygenase SsuD/methylene tetrahydromethanopterin reductase-like flavin-dependent oxidoreductase (luciferase family)
MSVGMFMTPQWQPQADLEHGTKELLELGRCARDAGFSTMLVGQHLLTGPEMQMLQTVPLMARLLPEIEGMRIGPGVLLLSMMNPIMAAEEAATLDWMSGGRYVLACGLGYRDVEFEAMNARKSERVSRLEEAVGLVKRLWTEQRVSHHGKHFTVNDMGASVRPKQTPRPPIWVGGDVEVAIRRAARIGDAWLASPTMSAQRLSEQLQVFSSERAASGQAATDCPIIRECFVGKNAKDARRIAHDSLAYKYRAYASWGHFDTIGHDLDNNFADFAKDRFLIGDAAEIRDELDRYEQMPGVGELQLRVQWPGLAHADALANIERIGALI